MSATYRDVLRWGDAKIEAHLEPRQIAALEGMLDLKLEPSKRLMPGDEVLQLPQPEPLPQGFLDKVADIVGQENLAADDFSRALHACGKFYGELIELRQGRVPHPPQAVAYPRSEDEVERLVALCADQRVPLIPFGGHSSVTRGLAAPRGGLSLDLTRHLNQVLNLSPLDCSVIVQPGIYGPALEDTLNRVGYTLGHFPQSFEFSTVGGWVATRGAGQTSTGYGKIEDMVLGLTMVTPAGVIRSKPFPAEAMGPDLDHLLIGSEGAFGVITQVTLQIRPHMPVNTRLASYLFKDFEPAVEAMHLIMQGRFGAPCLFRLSDPEETEAAFHMGGKSGGLGDRALTALGFQPGRRSLMMLSAEGDKAYARLVARKAGRIARGQGGLPLGAGPVRKWLAQRFSSAYLREPLMDLGLRTDTLETAVNWGRLMPLWSAVRAYVKSQPHTACLVHLSHIYENGANLYFTFIAPMAAEDGEAAEFAEFHRGLVDTIVQNGGSLSHHHGVGRTLGPWLEGEIGPTGMELLRGMKRVLDPGGVMNPGGTLGLDGEG
jgi:alkyldihydroxyacetonephosphate synthase